MKHVKVPYADTWGAMEELVRAGLVKNIGVCNLGTAMLRDLLSYAAIQPAVLQVEMHPYLSQQNLLRFCREQDIVVTAFSPFGASSYVPLQMADENESLFDDPVIQEIAQAHEKSVGQIALRCFLPPERYRHLQWHGYEMWSDLPGAGVEYHILWAGKGHCLCKSHWLCHKNP